MSRLVNTKLFVKEYIVPSELSHIDEVVNIYTEKLMENIRIYYPEELSLEYCIYFTLTNRLGEYNKNIDDCFVGNVIDNIQNRGLVEELTVALQDDNMMIAGVIIRY